MGKTGKRPTKPKGNGKPAPAKKPTPGCYVLSLTVENIRCFGPKQTLDCSDGEGRPRQWTVILGDNGTGKTTLLQSIALYEWIPNHSHEAFVTTPTTRVEFSGWPRIFRHPKASLRRSGKAPVVASGSLDVSTATSLAVTEATEHHTSTWSSDSDSGIAMRFGQHLECVYGYGVSRMLPGPQQETDATGFAEQTENVASLFGNASTVRNIERWIINLDYSVQKSGDERQRHVLDLTKQLLVNVLPDISGVRTQAGVGVAPVPCVELQTPFGWMPLRQLGHGYQTMAAWVTDFITRMVERYPESDSPLEERALCLVDEIDLHLHPVWQRKVIGYLSERFPNTQFIVTAHSPLVVQAAASANANIAVLVRSTEKDADGNHYVEIRNNPEDVRNWRLDQILTSDLFGGIDLRSAETAKLFARKRELLDKSKRTKPEEAELAEIEAKIAELPVGDSKKFSNDLQLLRDALDALKTTPQQ